MLILEVLILPQLLVDPVGLGPNGCVNANPDQGITQDKNGGEATNAL